MNLAALFGLYAAGLLTFASPCVLPLLPVYVALLGGAAVSTDDAEKARVRLRRAGLGFAAGLAIVFVLLGMGASLAASTLAAHRRGLQIAGGVAMMLFGLSLVGLLRLRVLDRDARPLLERVPTPGGFLGGALFGGAFAIGWTPCVGPVLGAALTYAASTSARPWQAGVQLAAYALGLATPLVAASFAAPRVIAWTKRLRSATPALQKVMGVALLGVGGLLALDRVSLFAPKAAPTTVASAGCASPSASACAPVSLDVAPSVQADALTGKPRLVEFVSGTCTVCARMAPVVESLAKKCATDGSMLRVSVDDESGKALASRYRVRVVPTFVSVDAAGAEVDRRVGEQSSHELARALGEVRGEACLPM